MAPGKPAKRARTSAAPEDDGGSKKTATAAAAAPAMGVSMFLTGQAGVSASSAPYRKGTDLEKRFDGLFAAGSSSSSTAAAVPQPAAQSSTAPAKAAAARKEAAAPAEAATSTGQKLSKKEKKAAAKAKAAAAAKASTDPAELGKKKKLTPEEQKVKDSRTMFIGNVPLSWDKNELKRRLREAAASVYSGPMKPIWFRSEPMDEMYRGFEKKKKAGSIQRRFSTSLNDSRNAYVMLQSQEDVKKVSLACHGLEADGRHVLQFDGVGEWSRNSKMDRKRSIFIGHLPADTTDADLRDAFRKIGEILTIRIVRDKFTQACKGIAFIKFKDRASVKVALSKWETMTVKGRWVRIKKVEEKPEEVLASKELAALHPAEMRRELGRRRHIGKRLASQIEEIAAASRAPKQRQPQQPDTQGGKLGNQKKLRGKEGRQMHAKKVKKGAQAKKIRAKQMKSKGG